MKGNRRHYHVWAAVDGCPLPPPAFTSRFKQEADDWVENWLEDLEARSPFETITLTVKPCYSGKCLEEHLG